VINCIIIQHLIALSEIQEKKSSSRARRIFFTVAWPWASQKMHQKWDRKIAKPVLFMSKIDFFLIIYFPCL
jgi:hypothetical protein